MQHSSGDPFTGEVCFQASRVPDMSSQTASLGLAHSKRHDAPQSKMGLTLRKDHICLGVQRLGSAMASF